MIVDDYICWSPRKWTSSVFTIHIIGNLFPYHRVVLLLGISGMIHEMQIPLYSAASKGTATCRCVDVLPDLCVDTVLQDAALRGACWGLD